MVDPGKQRPSTYEEWIIQVHGDLNNRRFSIEANATSHIFRVPTQIREVSTECFDSKFPFGLYDLETRTDTVLDTYRKDFAAIFMQITEKEWKDICSAVVGDSLEQVESWVKLYDGLNLESIIASRAHRLGLNPVVDSKGKGKLETHNGNSSHSGPNGDGAQPLDTIELIRTWLTLDAIFIVCFLQADHQRVCQRCKGHFPNLNKAMEKKTLKSIVHVIRLDIFKFENQIPLGLIRKVVTMMYKGKNSPNLGSLSGGIDPFKKFVVDAVSLIYCDLPGPRTAKEFEQSVNNINIDDSRHLLQCLYTVICHKAPNRGEAELVLSTLNPLEDRNLGREPPELAQSDLLDLEAERLLSTRGSEDTHGEGKKKNTEPRASNPPVTDEPISSRAESGAGDTPATGRGQEQAEPHSLNVGPEVANPGTDQDRSMGSSVQIPPAPRTSSSWSASNISKSLKLLAGHYMRGSAQLQERALLVDPLSNVDSQQRNPGGAQEQLQEALGTSVNRRPEIELVDISRHQNNAGGGHASQNPPALITGDGRRKKNSKELHPHHDYQSHVPTVTQLKEAGISVIVGQGDLKTKWISDVEFRPSTFQGKLYLPAIGVYDETESLLRNLLTYEYVVEDEKDLLSFVYLMDNLIDTEQDVKMMMDSGVLKNKSLGSDERVANMWNTLLTGVVLSLSEHYQTVFDAISPHYHNKWSRLVEEFRTIHLRKPWVVVGSILVVITFIATLLAMVYTILTYYYGNKQRAQT